MAVIHTAAAGVCGRGTQYAADRGDRNAQSEQYNLGMGSHRTPTTHPSHPGLASACGSSFAAFPPAPIPLQHRISAHDVACMNAYSRRPRPLTYTPDTMCTSDGLLSPLRDDPKGCVTSRGPPGCRRMMSRPSSTCAGRPTKGSTWPNTSSLSCSTAPGARPRRHHGTATPPRQASESAARAGLLSCACATRATTRHTPVYTTTLVPHPRAHAGPFPTWDPRNGKRGGSIALSPSSSCSAPTPHRFSSSNVMSCASEL